MPVQFYEIHSSNSDASLIHGNEKDEVLNFIDDEYLGSIGVMKLILLKSAIRVEQCYTCKKEFDCQMMVPPYNLIFCQKTKRL